MIMGFFPILCGFLYEFFIVDLGEPCGIIPAASVPVFGNNFHLFTAPRARPPPG